MKKYYNVIVYSGRAHWDQPIEELCDGFYSRREAEQYAQGIERYRPDYFIEIIPE